MIVWLGRSERWPLRHDGEQNYAAGEYVDFGSLVVLSKVDFWRHVGHCAKFSAQEPLTITAIDWGRESKV